MLNPNESVTIGLGNNMKKFFYCLVIAIAALLPAPSVRAADMDVPPPMGDLRPATYDWSGPYVGVFGAAVAVDGSYDGICTGTCGPASLVDLEHSGIGYAAGILGGYNYQMDALVFGIEGDWAFGGTVATNDEFQVDTDLSFNNIATLRARLGWAMDNTLFYVTGGAAMVDMEFGAVMSSTESDSQWAYGWTAGAGMEHAFSDNISGRIEYLYVGLPDTDFSMTDAAPTTLDAAQSFNDIHMVRAGLTYNFGW
jgi:outer membrane immunogenic protein